MKKRKLKNNKITYNKENNVFRYKKYNIYQTLFRYIILLGIILLLPVIYFIATPLTIYPVNFILNLFIKTQLIIASLPSPVFILGEKILITIIPSCIAGSAYLLLFILNLSVPMPFKKRFYSIILSIIILLTFNILRITFFSMLYYFDLPFIDFTHMLFWYVISTIFVIGLWFFNVKIFKIKEIPVYSDIKNIYNTIKYDK